MYDLPPRRRISLILVKLGPPAHTSLLLFGTHRCQLELLRRRRPFARVERRATRARRLRLGLGGEGERA